MVSIPLPNQSSKATTHVSKNESSPYDGFQRIELLDGDARGPASVEEHVSSVVEEAEMKKNGDRS
jgi:hypothetical protein